MRVYVTGASGFVGQRLLPRLRSAGHTVPSAAESEVDVCDPAALEAALAGARPDAVIHLAAQSSVAASRQQPLECFRVNVLGTQTLLGVAAHCAPSARLLLVGSGDQYGPAAPGAPAFRESDPMAPRSPYAWSKAAAEWLGELAAREGRDVVRVRAFNHTGAGQSERFVASTFARQVAEIAAGRRPPRMEVGNLSSLRDFLDVDDVVDAYLALLDPAVPADVYNVASGHGITVQSLLDELIAIAGIDPEIRVDPERFRPTDASVGDASRLRAATGWQPRRPLRETLSGLIAGWRAELAGATA